MLRLTKKVVPNVFEELSRELTEEEIEEYRNAFLAEDINQDESYMVTFKDGVFTIQFGNPTLCYDAARKSKGR
ncbi:hypothetical protein [Neobacillus sp. YIM B06451]|uniref:hypothetical protein n=1 Tax=Neobacillus sp. YIM B06451 TaxID=3070994 RepID=UPI00292DB209|nr:hypothetical protein [Neobacillus sp. YIM B06451]